MKRVKMTVRKALFYPDLADEYLSDGRAAGPCPILKEGDVFVYEGGAVMPQGFCPWAWIDIYRSVHGAHLGADTMPWTKRPGRQLVCCTDGIRPVLFEVETLEEMGD